MALREAGPERLGAFSDGVIAVIITIMVLDLKAPHEASLHALLKLWPGFLSYALSYFFVGIVWINHHHLLRYVERVTTAMIATNFIFLFFVSLIPFFTAYVAASEVSAFATAIYAAVFLLTTLAYIVFELAIFGECSGAREKQERQSLSRWRNWVALAASAVAIPCAYLHAGLALGLLFLVSVFYSSPYWGRGAEES